MKGSTHKRSGSTNSGCIIPAGGPRVECLKKRGESARWSAVSKGTRAQVVLERKRRSNCRHLLGHEQRLGFILIARGKHG